MSRVAENGGHGNSLGNETMFPSREVSTFSHTDKKHAVDTIHPRTKEKDGTCPVYITTEEQKNDASILT